MDEENNRDLEIILNKWGAEENLHRFLEDTLQELCPKICGTSSPIPKTQVKPSWLAKGLFGEHDNAGADYESEEGEHPATISIFPSIAHDENLIRLGVAHELIHHWEHLNLTMNEQLSYPKEADLIISQRYRNPTRESSWRSGHSKMFISNAAKTAEELGTTLGEILFR